MKKLLENIGQNHRWSQWFAIGLIMIITTIIYLPSLNAPFILDDMGKIVNNPDIKKISNIKNKLIYPYSKNKIWERNDPSRPVAYLTFTLNYYFGKLNPFGYHLFNLLIHIFNAILLFFLTKKIISLILISRSLALSSKLSEDPDLSGLSSSLVFPLFVALLFAVHPVNTSSVSYIFSRSVILATFFYLLSLLLFINATKKNLSIFQSFNLSYILSLLCFVLALFSRQDAVTLPAIILIFDYIFLSDYKMSKVTEKKYYHIPFWTVIIIFLSFRYFYLGGIGDMDATHLPKRFIYFINQPYAILRYLGLLLVPIGICIDRGSFLAIESIYELKTIISFVITVGILLLFWWFCNKRRVSKIVLFSVLWFFITLSPTSSFFPTTSIMVDNRLYISGYGFYLIIVFLYFKLLRLKKNLYLNRVATMCIVMYILILSVYTNRRNHFFQQPILLWQEIVSKYPHYRAYNNLGNLYKNEKKYVEAEKLYNKALVFFPDSAEIYYNIGKTYYEQEKYREAMQSYKKAIDLNPKYANTYNSLGILYSNMKEYNNAIQSYQKAIEINPNYVQAHINLGRVYYFYKDYAKAHGEYQKAIEIDPNYINTYNGLGLLYHAQGDYNNAIQQYQKAIKINSNFWEAHYNLGRLYYDQKEYEKALQEFNAVSELYPNDQSIKYKIKLLQQLILRNRNNK